MIPDIGIIIGLYIVTRMLHLVTTVSGKSASIVRVFAALTMVVTVIVLVDLLLQGTSTPVMPSF